MKTPENIEEEPDESESVDSDQLCSPVQNNNIIPVRTRSIYYIINVVFLFL